MEPDTDHGRDLRRRRPELLTAERGHVHGRPTSRAPPALSEPAAPSTVTSAVLRPLRRASLLTSLALGGCFQDQPPSFATSTASSTGTSTGASTGTSSSSSGSTTGSTSDAPTSTSDPTSTGPLDPSTTGPQTGSSSTGAPDMGPSLSFNCPDDTRLAACYLFDDDPTKLTDGSPNGWHGTMLKVALVPGHRGLAAQTGADAAITGTALDGPKGGPEWTMMAWVKLSQFSPQRSGVLNRNGDYGIFIEIDGRPQCTGGGQVLTSPAPISLDTWTHLACVRSGGSTALFVDGTGVAKAMLMAPVPPDPATLVIANDSPPSPLHALLGSIDEILLWNTPLTVDEICTHAGLTC